MSTAREKDQWRIGTPSSGVHRSTTWQTLLAYRPRKHDHVDVDIAGGLAVWPPVADKPDDVIGVGLPFLRAEARKAGLTLG